MQNNRLKLLVLILSLVFSSLNATQEVCVYAIPGINGRGSEPSYVQDLLGDKQGKIIHVETPRKYPDLGQARCIFHLHEAFIKGGVGGPVIIHATSQGAATALNYFTQVDKGVRIKALILEAPVVSGNSAVIHTAKGPLMNKPAIVNLPLSYYWIPYYAKTRYPWYWPCGKQPIKSIVDIPDHVDIPIIIIHAKNDPQISYDDSCALYYGLSLKKKNVYFISKEGQKHINIIQEDSDKKVIQAILQKHNLLPHTLEKIDLTLYQPDPSSSQKIYEELIAKEKKHVFLGYALLITAAGILMKSIVSFSRYIKEKIAKNE